MRTELSQMLELERLLQMKKLQSERALRRAQDRLEQLKLRARAARLESRAALAAEQAANLGAHILWQAGQTRHAEKYEAEIEAMAPDIAALRAATREASRQSLAIEEIITDLRLREALVIEEAEERKREAAVQLKAHMGASAHGL